MSNTRVMKSLTIATVACVFGLCIATARLCATDDTKPSNDKPSSDKSDTEKPIKSLKDLMQRMQKQNSDALIEARRSDTAKMLGAAKKIEGYVDQFEKWIPDKVSKDEAKKKRFLELKGQLQKSVQETVKLLEASDLKKGSAEYAKANGSCTTCHNEFRPKK